MSVRIANGNWACDVVLDPERLSDDHREVFGLLMDLDPVFTLRFHEGNGILVNAARAEDGECLAFTVYGSAKLRLARLLAADLRSPPEEVLAHAAQIEDQLWKYSVHLCIKRVS
ncbi:hypothetical protein [Kitasatospora sp. NPDC004272]